MTAEQVASWVEPAKSIKEAKSLDEYLQRTLKDRGEKIANYLLENEHRFFNSIIVGVYDGIPDWVEFEIYSKVRELGGDADTTEGTMGLLAFDSNVRMFAIDGQHRVEGIKKAFQLDVAKRDATQLLLKDDKFSVVFLAHVDDEEGRKRTRRLFSDINNKAVGVPKKDRIIIDEEDICAIVTRKIYTHYPHFNSGELIAITDSQNLEKGDVSHFTNLTNLHTVIQKLKPNYKKDKNTLDWDDTNVEKLLSITEDFFNFIVNNILDYKDYFVHKKIDLAQLRENNNHLLFRPIGLTLLAKIYAYFSKSGELDYLSENLKKIDFTFPNGQFNKALWNKGKLDTKSTTQTLAFHLALYLLNRYEKTVKLKESYQELLKNENVELPEKVVVDETVNV